jgi:hypothetical protein
MTTWVKTTELRWPARRLGSRTKLRMALDSNRHLGAVALVGPRRPERKR